MAGRGKWLTRNGTFVEAILPIETGMEKWTMTPAEKLATGLIEATEKLLKAAGFVKIGGRWVSTEDAKADAR